MGARWGDQEWVKTVEKAYWMVDNDAGPDCSTTLDGIGLDAIADFVIRELCSSSADGPGATEEAFLQRRRAALRTQYRAVVSEVIGLAVKW